MHWGDEGKAHRDPDAPGGPDAGGPPTRPPPRHGDDGPWYARIGAGVLSERGLGALLSIILVVSILWGGAKLLADVSAFQGAMIAQTATMNERLAQLQADHLAMKIQMDRIERMLLAANGGP